jgi:hypothetical protein
MRISPMVENRHTEEVIKTAVEEAVYDEVLKGDIRYNEEGIRRLQEVAQKSVDFELAIREIELTISVSD